MNEMPCGQLRNRLRARNFATLVVNSPAPMAQPEARKLVLADNNGMPRRKGNEQNR